MYTGQADAKDIFSRVVHEFTHSFQTAAGFGAQWIWEGGAVLNECVMEALPGSATMGVTKGTSFRACVKSKIFPGVVDAYQMVAATEPGAATWAASGKTMLEFYGET